MTQFHTMRNIAAATTFAAITGFTMFAQSGSASAREILNCEGAGRRSVVECCEAEVKKTGLPMWMKQTGRNCATSVRCGKAQVGAAAIAVRRCWVVLLNNETDDRKHGGRRGRK